MHRKHVATINVTVLEKEEQETRIWVWRGDPKGGSEGLNTVQSSSLNNTGITKQPMNTVYKVDTFAGVLNENL